MPHDTRIVADVGLRPVHRVRPDVTVREAAELLHSTQCGTLLVATHPACEVTDADVVRAIARGAGGDDPLVDAAPTRRPVFAAHRSSVDDAAALMVETGRRSVLVVADDEVVVGLLMWPDLLGALLGGNTWLGAFRMALHVEGNPR